MRTTTAPPLEAFSRTVELCNFGIGLVAGFLLVTCAYFSNTKFDAIHIGPLSKHLSLRASAFTSSYLPFSPTLLTNPNVCVRSRPLREPDCLAGGHRRLEAPIR